MAGADGGVKSFVPRGNSERALGCSAPPRYRCCGCRPPGGQLKGKVLVCPRPLMRNQTASPSALISPESWGLANKCLSPLGYEGQDKDGF